MSLLCGQIAEDLIRLRNLFSYQINYFLFLFFALKRPKLKPTPLEVAFTLKAVL